MWSKIKSEKEMWKRIAEKNKRATVEMSLSDKRLLILLPVRPYPFSVAALVLGLRKDSGVKFC